MNSSLSMEARLLMLKSTVEGLEGEFTFFAAIE